MFREWIINGFDSYKGPLCVFIINGRYFEVGYSPESHRVVFYYFPLLVNRPDWQHESVPGETRN